MMSASSSDITQKSVIARNISGQPAVLHFQLVFVRIGGRNSLPRVEPSQDKNATFSHILTQQYRCWDGKGTVSGTIPNFDTNCIRFISKLCRRDCQSYQSLASPPGEKYDSTELTLVAYF